MRSCAGCGVIVSEDEGWWRDRNGSLYCAEFYDECTACQDGESHNHWVVARYRCRDIGYGVEVGDVILPALGPMESFGKRPYTAIASGSALTDVVYLFDDEIPEDEVEDVGPWYNDRDNLHLLADFMKDRDPHGAAGTIVHMLEKPWNYGDEFQLAKAVRDHEFETDHVVQPMHDDMEWYCSGPGDGTECDWQWPEVSVEDRVEDLERIKEGLE